MARLPDVTTRDELPENERWAFDDMVRTRGKILPGYAPLLHCAELVGRVVNVGTFFRFSSSLPAGVLETVALAVSTALHDRYEQAVHRGAAQRAGLPAPLVDALCSGDALPDAPPDEALVARCARTLLATHALPDADFAALRARFGERGAVELVTAIGFYAMLAYVHNAVDVTPPAETASPGGR